MIEVLGSGIALGVYVPPLLFAQSIGDKYSYNFSVLENTFTQEICNKILNNKSIFHKNFRIAKKAHQLPMEIEHCIDQNKLTNLFNNWYENKTEIFCAFSGFWLPILQQYKEKIGKDIRYACIHMDAAESNSWRSYNADHFCNDYWLFSEKNKSVNYYMGLEKFYNFIPIAEREERIVVHGGGWGMGTYKNVINEMVTYGLPINFIQYQYDEMKELKEFDNVELYYLNEKWIPWNENHSDFYFPEMLMWSKKEQKYKSFSENNKHSFYEILNHSIAIVSKPGGGTLLDSFETNTPIIFLEPLGNYEKSNANLWIEKGFGLSYEEWKKTGFSFEILRNASERIKTAKNDTKILGEILCSRERK